ncbi:MAG: magnesium transporter [Firmicutes bacterium]|nr:magnesium transporter [Bacillota bacterium]
MLERILELLEEKNLAVLRQEILAMNEVDIAEVLDNLPRNRAVEVFRILPKTIQWAVFSYVDYERQEIIIRSMRDAEITELMSDMFDDDAADFLEEMPAEIVKRVLQACPKEDREKINRIMCFRPKTGGAIMTSEFVDFVENTSVGKALSEIRKIALDKETVYNIYVLNINRRLMGKVAMSTLLTNKDDVLLKDIMTTGAVAATTADDQESIANTMKKYDLLSLPIVDSENRLVGIVTIDDALDILTQEATEDIQIMAAVLPSDKPYLKTGVFSLAKNRMPWLALLMLISIFTATVIEAREEMLTAIVVLVALMPKMIDTAGTAGSQSAALVIRGMAIKEVERRDALRIAFKEIRVGLICGAILAVISVVPVLIVHDFEAPFSLGLIWLVIGLSIITNVALANILGGLLPIIASRLKIDPAVMSAPVITTLADIGGLMIYFTYAMWILF